MTFAAIVDIPLWVLLFDLFISVGCGLVAYGFAKIVEDMASER